MNVTRDVANDLVPLYLAGEASADTRALLEEYMRANPDFARAVKDHAERSAGALGQFVPELPPDHEKATLERVRRFNRRRSHVLGLAIGSSLLPLSFVFEGGGVRWIMLRDNPQMAVFFSIAAAGCWIAYQVMGRRLRSDA
jgi:ferric-dicitrate binding protein FerR (iron transport regulator)